MGNSNNPPPLFIFSFLFFIIISNHHLFAESLANQVDVEFENTNTPPPLPPPEARLSNNSSKPPGVAVIAGILTTIFSITFLLLLYMKHCKRPENYATTYVGHAPARVNSGLNRKVIGSLPTFRFSSLRGQKDGLECAVCLSQFEPEEVLRLLPKCKHAFHVECVDTWLDAHSTCPLCRYRVDPEDVLLIDFNHSQQTTPRNSDQRKGNEFLNPRVSGRHSSAGERGNSLEIIVEKPGPDLRGRISLDSWNSRRKTGNKNNKLAENQGRRSADSWKGSRKDGQLPVKGEKHRLDHRIIIRGAAAEEEGEGRRRWSDVQASEFLYLQSESILGGGGGGEEEGGSGRGVINGRSVSEITGMSRYRDNNGGGREKEEERAVKRWLAWISQSQQQETAVLHTSSSSSIVVV